MICDIMNAVAIMEARPALLFSITATQVQTLRMCREKRNKATYLYDEGENTGCDGPEH